MNWEEYLAKFDAVLSGENSSAPYDQEAYKEYVKLNQSRINRWMKKSLVTDDMQAILNSIDEPQQWILITEPWCGDAAHSTPAIKQIADASDKINFDIVLRDSSDMIDSYLTNGGKAIPKLVVRDSNGNDLFTWGARPKEAQDLVIEMKSMENLSIQDRNMKLQQWYNKNKGTTIQNELGALLQGVYQD